MLSVPLHVQVGDSWYTWHAHPDVLILIAGLLVAYWYAVVVWRPHIPDAGRVKRTQVACYLLGVATVYVAAGTPIHEIGEGYLLSVHMTQHLLLSLVAPPLLLAGIPTWLWEALLVRKRVLPVARVLLNPLVAIGFFNAVLVITHLPEVMNYNLTHHWAHFVAHVVIVSSSVVMWWPVITSVPNLPRLSYPYQMAYLFVQSLIPSVVAAFIVFTPGAAYSYYETAPRIWGMSPVEDQQWGAFVMKIVGSLILWAFIGVAFFRWFAREEAEARGLPWHEVEEELHEIGVTPRRDSRLA
jgi:putative membrane protein